MPAVASAAPKAPRTKVKPGLTLVKAQGFKAVPYLETSELMRSHPQGVRLSTRKPNVIVGPNGAGKSALLRALALRTLSVRKGLTELDQHYVRYGAEAEKFWSIQTCWDKGPLWGERQATFLPGLTAQTHNAPALYYRPGHIPGEERCATTAMMTGYFDSAREFMAKTEKKSSGQAHRALLERLMQTLERGELPAPAVPERWGRGLSPRVSKGARLDDQDLQHNALLELVTPEAGALALVLMDEPEQSLDARAELQLWRTIAAVDCSRLQVVVATHSLYPLLNPHRFNLIEATPGYIEEVRALL